MTVDLEVLTASRLAAYRLGGVEALLALSPPPTTRNTALEQGRPKWMEEAMAAALVNGWDVVLFDGTCDYQGDGALLLTRSYSANPHFPPVIQWATLTWGYGSCSGCDAYEDDPDVVGTLAKNIDLAADEAAARMAFDGGKGW